MLLPAFRRWASFGAPAARRFPFALVADMDRDSKVPNAKARWQSVLKHGALVEDAGSRASFHVEWSHEEELATRYARKDRGMELSALIRWNDTLWSVCDSTGIVYEVSNDRPRRVVPRIVLADGNKNFKAEWATIKDGKLLVGSLGRDWLDGDVVVHQRMCWVKEISPGGEVVDRDWRTIYEKIRRATGTLHPGYLTHEAIHWDAAAKRWLALPRKASLKLYDEKTDERMGTNILIIASEDWNDIEVVPIGPKDPEWGYTAIKMVPGQEHKDPVFVATSAYEIDNRMATRLAVFDEHGRSRLTAGAWHLPVSEDVKFEGVEFF